MRKVICGMKSAEVGCGTVGNMRNAEWLTDRSITPPAALGIYCH